MTDFAPLLGPVKPRPHASAPAADPDRVCPNCGVPESRWTVGSVEHVNLDPFTNNCVDCLRELAKEMRANPPTSLPFDARAAQARNDV